MTRYNNNGKAGWGSSRPDMFPNGSSCRIQPTNCLNFGGFNRPPFEDLEMENRHGDETQHGDPLDVCRDETDRRFENLEPVLSREAEPPSRFDNGEEYEDDEFRGKRPWDRGNRPHHQNFGRREGNGRSGSAWDQSGYGSARNRFSGYNQAFERPASLLRDDFS